MQTETLDKLYLEWSQFTRARTARELELSRCLRLADEALRKQRKLDNGQKMRITNALIEAGAT